MGDDGEVGHGEFNLRKRKHTKQGEKRKMNAGSGDLLNLNVKLIILIRTKDEVMRFPETIRFGN